MSEASSPLERLAPWAAGALFALPVLVAYYPPMTDLPLHEAVVGVLRHMGDPRFMPPGLYRYNLGHPNQLFHVVAWGLSYGVGTRWAVKLVVAAAELGLFVGAARLADHVGTPRWTALLAGGIGLGWMFYWGLLANMVGLGIFLACIPVLEHHVDRPSARSAAEAAGVMLLLYFAHETVMLCAALLVAVFAVGYGARLRDIRALALRAAPIAFAGALSGLQLVWQEPLRGKVSQAVGIVVDPLLHKLDIVPGVLFAGYERPIRTLLFLMPLTAFVLFARARAAERPKVRGATLRERWHRYRYEIFVGLLLVAYFVLPATLKGATIFYHRFLLPAYAIAVVVVAPREAAGRARARVACLIAALLPAASVLAAWPNFVLSDRLVRDLDAVAAHAEPNSAFLATSAGVKAPRIFAELPLEGHVLALRGGRSLFDSTRSPISPAFMPPDLQWPVTYVRIGLMAGEVRPTFDMDQFRYVYLHSQSQQALSITAEALLPDARHVFTQGEWSLFESTHWKGAMVAAERPLPYPRPHTLRWRANEVLRRLRGEPPTPEQPQKPPAGWVGPPLALPESAEPNAVPPQGEPTE